MSFTITQRHLSVFLYLTWLHSFCIGIALIILPNPVIELFGFTNLDDRFFRTQAGVFHFVVSLTYLYAARDITGRQSFISYSIFIKFIATIFLLSYFLFVERTAVTLLSALADFFMGNVIYFLNRRVAQSDR